jgi:hypothetical protein
VFGAEQAIDLGFEASSEKRMAARSEMQRDQIFRDFKVRRNGHTNLDQGSAAERVFGATSTRGAPPLRHATSHRQDPAEADHKIIQKLNRLELSRLLKARERR